MSDVVTQKDIIRLEQQIVSLHEMICSLLSRNENDDVLTLSEAAAFLKVSKRTLQRYVAADPSLGFRPSGKAKGDLRFYKSRLLSIEPKKTRSRGRKPRRVSVI